MNQDHNSPSPPAPSRLLPITTCYQCHHRDTTKCLCLLADNRRHPVTEIPNWCPLQPSENASMRRPSLAVVHDRNSTHEERLEALMTAWNEALFKKDILQNALLRIAHIPPEHRTGLLGKVVAAAKEALNNATT